MRRYLIDFNKREVDIKMDVAVNKIRNIKLIKKIDKQDAYVEGDELRFENIGTSQRPIPYQIRFVEPKKEKPFSITC